MNPEMTSIGESAPSSSLGEPLEPTEEVPSEDEDESVVYGFLGYPILRSLIVCLTRLVLVPRASPSDAPSSDRLTPAASFNHAQISQLIVTAAR